MFLDDNDDNTWIKSLNVALDHRFYVRICPKKGLHWQKIVDFFLHRIFRLLQRQLFS